MTRRSRQLGLARGLPARILSVWALSIALVLVAAPAGAHAYLESSTPAPGGSVPEGTTVLALRFTEQIDPDHVDVHLENASGVPVDTETDVPDARPAEVRVLSDPLPNGTYQLSWNVLSVDGHAEEGSMGFTVGNATEGASGLVDRTGAPPAPLDVLDGLARALLLAGVLATVGLPLFTSEVARLGEIPRRVPATLAAFLGVSLVGVTVRAGVLARSIDAGALAALNTRPGGYLLTQALFVLLALGAVGVAWTRPADERSSVLVLAVLPASLAVIVNSMGGHGVIAYTSREAVAGHVARTLHVLIVGLWGGSVLGFLVVRGRDRLETATLVRRFFPIGVISVVVLGVTGTYQAYVHLPRAMDLWTSPYGWMLLGKILLLVVLVGAGAVHQRWMAPLLERGRATVRGFRRLVGSELAVIASTVALAGVLAATPLPEASPSQGDGPLAVFEDETRTQDFDVRLSLDEDTVRAGEEHVLRVELRPRTSLGVQDVTVNLSAHPPSGDGARPIELEPEDEGVWRAERVVFEEPGTWGLLASLHTPAGVQEASFEVPVS